MNKKIFSEKTRKRMDILKQRLMSYEESIQRLHQFTEGRLTSKSKNYTFGAKQYERTLQDEQHFIFTHFIFTVHHLKFTVHHLKEQMRFCQHELDVLQEYGC